MAKPVVILGGGLAGLTAAYELSKNGEKVIVIEKEKEPRGMLRSVKAGDTFIEQYYHHIFPGNKNFESLLKEFGLFDKFKWTTTQTAFYYHNQFCKLSAPLDIFSFKPLSISDKFTLARLMLKIKMIPDTSAYDNVSTKEWVHNSGGENVYNKLFKPLLEGKYGEHTEDTSAAWFIERMKLRSKRGMSGERLGYLKGGFRSLIERLQEEILKNRGEIHTGTEIKKVETENGVARSISFDKKEIEIKALISTIPPATLSKIVDLPKIYEDKIERVEYQGAACVLIALPFKLTNFYWTNIMRDDIIFKALVEHTNFQKKEEYGTHLIYLASYPDNDSKVWSLSEKDVFELYFADMKKLFPQVNDKDILWWKVFRDRHAGLVYKKDMKKDLLGYTTPIKNIFLGGMFNSYPERSIELSIIKGKECARLVSNLIQ